MVGVVLGDDRESWSLEASLDELAVLARTAGVKVVGRSSQRLSKANAGFMIGQGKVEEIKSLAAELQADVILFDRELSPRQQRNLERELDIKVIDRTALILDVFARHARSREGMLQVELAQMEYRLPRLTRMWTHLARQAGGRAGGGVGLRGPGETQIEIDRREIGKRISFLKGQIANLRDQRRRSRRRRRRAGLSVVALVGYTNAGKSTLLNALTGEDAVYAADQLFATLDPTTRRVTLPSGRVALFTDTVGFIQNLPTQLVAAFSATLEELLDADLLLHVVDVTHPDAVRQAETVESVLGEMDMSEHPMVIAANKVDRIGPGAGAHPALSKASAAGAIDAAAREGAGTGEDESGQERSGSSPAEPMAAAEDEDPYFEAAGPAEVLDLLQRLIYPDLVPVSAKDGQGIGALLSVVDEALTESLHEVQLLVPYASGEVLNLLHTHGVVEKETHDERGSRVQARVPGYLLGELEDCLLEPDTPHPLDGEALGTERR